MEEKENTKNNVCLRFETKIKTPKLDQKLLAGTKNKQSVHVY